MKQLHDVVFKLSDVALLVMRKMPSLLNALCAPTSYRLYKRRRVRLVDGRTTNQCLGVQLALNGSYARI